MRGIQIILLTILKQKSNSIAVTKHVINLHFLTNAVEFIFYL